jgi:hypothetical protein
VPQPRARRGGHAARTPKPPLELRPPFHTREAGGCGHREACVLVHALVRVIEGRLLRRPGIDQDAKNALHDLRRFQRAPVYHAGITIAKNTTPNEHQKARLHAVGAPTPERCTAALYKTK